MESRIIVLGTTGSGKSSALKAVSAANPVMTSAVSVPRHGSLRLESGVMDCGRGTPLGVHVAPSLTGYDESVDELITRASGVLLLIDHATPNPAGELRRFQKSFERRRDPRPIVVGVTRTDVAPHRPMSVYREAVLKNRGYPLPVLAMDARKPLDVRAAIVTLLALIEVHRRVAPADAPHAPAMS